jgi:hypothetical protein
MKWNEMSTFQRVLHVICLICTLAYLVFGVLYFADVLPSSYAYALSQIMFGCAWLCRAIILWETQRRSAIGFVVLAMISFCLAIAHCIVK